MLFVRIDLIYCCKHNGSLQCERDQEAFLIHECSCIHELDTNVYKSSLETGAPGLLYSLLRQSMKYRKLPDVRNTKKS